MEDEPFTLVNLTAEDYRNAAAKRKADAKAKSAATRLRSKEALIAKNRRWDSKHGRRAILKRAIQRHALALARHMGLQPAP